MSDKRIKLNVGGIFYETTDTTLLSVNGESNYFSLYLARVEKSLDRVTNEGETTIELFIDRSGFLFQYVLDYLRTGTIVAVPDKDHIIRGLLLEADFYLLESLSLLLSKKLEEQAMDKLNSKMELMASQSTLSEFSVSTYDYPKRDYQLKHQHQHQHHHQHHHHYQHQHQHQHHHQHLNSIIVNQSQPSCGCYARDQQPPVLKENKTDTENNYLKFEFSLDEDF